jgi:uncharacterized membrane protein
MISKELLIILTAALPVSELRGAIPLGISLGEGVLKTFCLAVLGNILPVAPLLVLLKPVSERLRYISFFRKFFNWLFERTRRKSGLVQKYEAIGLILFVAIPLPVTGAWTGSVAASLFNLKFRLAFPAIIIGVVIAGIIVTFLVLTGRYLVS